MTRVRSPRISGAALVCGGDHDVANFYGHLFGWTDGDNTITAPDGETVGRRVDAPDRRCRGWVPVLSSTYGGKPAESFRIESLLGGELWTDVEGAAFMTESESSAESGAAPLYRATDERPGHLSWAQLNTVSLEAAEHRYSPLLGWVLAPSDNDKFTYRRFLLDGQVHAGVMRIDARSGEDVVPQWQLYFRVDDVAGAAALITQAGGVVVVEPTHIAGGAFAVALDPAGHIFAIDRMTRSSEVDR